MIEYLPLLDASAPTLEGKVKQIRDYLLDFIPKYNLMAQEVNQLLAEKEKDNGKQL